MGRQVFLAFFGGSLAPGRVVRLGDPVNSMDPVIQTAYFSAITALGGDYFAEQQVEYEMRRQEWLDALLTAEPAYWAENHDALASEGPPDEMVRLAGRIDHVFDPVSDNTWVRPAADIAEAVRMALLYLRPGDVIRELVLLDHGVMGDGHRFIGMAFGRGLLLVPESFEPTDNVALQMLRLRPWVDDQTVMTLAGCSVASNATGITMLRRLAQLLGVRTHGYVEDQLLITSGVDGTVIECRPVGECGPIDGPTTFANRIYGARTGDWGNVVGFE